MEAVQFVKLRHVEAQLHQSRILECEALALFEGNVLHRHVGHGVKVVVPKLVERNLGVRLHDVVVASGPFAVLIAASHIGEIEEIVAIVDEHRVERGGVQVLNLTRLIGQHDVEHLALLCLEYWLNGFWLWLWCRHVGFHEFAFYHQRPLVGGVMWLCGIYHHNFLLKGGTLKSILILNIHHLTLHSGHLAASHII